MAMQLPRFRSSRTDVPQPAGSPPEAPPPPLERPASSVGRRSFSVRTGRAPVAKGLLVALPLLVIGALAFFLTQLGSQVAQLQETVADRERQAEVLTEANDQLNKRVEQLTQERDQAVGEAGTAREQLDSAAVSLQQTRDALAAMQAEYDQYRASSATLEERLAALQQQHDERQQRLTALEADRQTWERSLARLRERLAFADRDYQRVAQRLAELERRPQSASPLPVVMATGPVSPASPAGSEPKPALVEASGSTRVEARTPEPAIAKIREQQPGAVELPPIVVSSKHRVEPAGPVRARLVEVNQPYRFIVVDKGTEDGVRLGMTFDIVRGASAVVGQARVVQVRPSLAACDVVRMKSAEPPRIGDSAVERGR